MPPAAARKVARSAPVRRADRKIRKGVSRGKRIGQVRKASDYSKKLSKHLKKERAKATKKNGDFKKGWDQRRVMAAAHRCVKREMRR